MSGRRVERIAERIREEASQIILFELSDPRIKLVTVTKVEISGDLSHAKIYVSVLGDEARRRTVLRGLASARGLVRSRISKSLGLREAPLITFEFDPSIEKAIEVSKLIDRVSAELAQSPSAPATESPSPSEPEPEDDLCDEEADAWDGMADDEPADEG